LIPITSNNHLDALWPQGSSKMAGMIRGYSWERTSLGPLTDWSQSLRTTVDLVLGSPMPMVILYGPDLVQIYNDAYSDVMGSKHPAGLGQKTQDCWPEVWHINEPLYRGVFSGEAFTFEDSLYPLNRNGYVEDVWLTLSYSPLRDEKQSVSGVLVTLFETTSKVRAEAARQASEARLKQAQEHLRGERMRLTELFRQAPAFMAVLRGPDHTFEMTNPLYQELIGHRHVTGKPVREAVPESEAQGFPALLDEVYRSGESFVAHSQPIDLARSSGAPLERRYLDFVYQAIREADGTVSGIMALGVDVTERQQAEEALRTTEKLAAVGRLASSIAHEINNPLEAVTNLLFLARGSTDMQDVQTYLELADQELRRVAAISSQTLRFHKQSTSPTLVTCDELIGSTLLMYRPRLANSQIVVEKRKRCTRPVLCFEGEIRQVLSNLVSNAIDAMHGSGGRLLLRSRAGHHWSSGRTGLVITVGDTGPGMAVGTLKRIFEVFFTTKGIGGTGLGLWLSAEIIERHAGALRVRSAQRESRHGTVFTIFLPFDAVIR
jgi:PAS domain S-box-containing protein